MPNIDTLIGDIYALFDDASITEADLLETFSKDLSGVVGGRLDNDRRGNAYLRLSNIGTPCDRKLWYDVNGTEPEKLSGATSLKFMYGDILEHLLLYLARRAGHEVSHEQVEVDVEGVKGHPDAIIDGVLVDIKSASQYAFQKFATGSLLESGNDAFGYVAQLAGYRYALGHEGESGFLAIDKVSGKMTLLIVPSKVLDEYDVLRRVRHTKEVINQDAPPNERLPSVPDGKSGNHMLGVNCGYCWHKEKCWSHSNDGIGLRTFFYANGPRFLTQVTKLPNVPEKGNPDGSF